MVLTRIKVDRNSKNLHQHSSSDINDSEVKFVFGSETWTVTEETER